MPTITSTELGALGRYVYFDQAAFDGLGSQTVLAYCRPTASGGGGFAYMYGKTPTGSLNGPRFFINHNAGAPRVTFGAHSSLAGSPTRESANNSATYNSWGHYAFSWDGSLTGANIHIYSGVGVDLAENTYSATTNGTTAVASDAANPAYLMNRFGLGREFIGDVAYIAVWDGVLSLAQLRNAQNNGPLAEPTGLVLLWANQADLGPNALTETGRSTYAAGAIPPNTALGGSTAVDLAAAAAAVASASGTLDSGTVDLAADAAAVASATGDLSAGPVIVIADDFERSSVNVAGSTISGVGDSAVITLKPRLQESEVASSQTRWLTPIAKFSGVGTFRPTFRFSDYGSGAGKYHGYPWEAGRKPMFAYDIAGPWYYFDTCTVGATEIEFRHNTGFTSDVVYVSKGRVRTPTQTGAWVDGLEASYPSLIHNLPSNTSGFVSGTFTAQTDELGRTIPAQPFYGFKVSDASLTPDFGDKKAMVLVAGVHAGEDQGDLVLAEAVEFLLSADAKAQNVRKHFDVYVYPLLNAPGRAGGGWRGSFTQGTGGIDDANRHFSDASPGLEIVTIPRAAMTTDLPAVIPVMIDFHGQYADKWGLFKDAGVTAHDTFDTAVEVYIGAGQYVSLGASNAGFTAKYFNSAYSTEYYITTEAGDPTPITEADITAFGEAHIKAVSDLQDAGRFGDMLHGTAAATAAATGALSVSVPLAAASVSVATAGGAMSVSIPLAGAANATANASGGLSLSIPLAASAVAQALASAGVSVAKPLSAAAIAESLASATIDTAGAVSLSGAAVAQALASAALAHGVPLSADAVANAVSAAGLSNGIALDGAAASEAIASAALALSEALVGGAASTSAASGGLSINISLSGTAIAAAAAGAGLTVQPGDSLAGDAAAIASAAGALAHAVPLTGVALAVTSAGSNLTQLVSVSASAASAAMATGGLDVSVQLDGAALAVALAQAGLTHIPASMLAGGAVGEAQATGLLTLYMALNGSAVAQAIASGALAAQGLLTAASVRQSWTVNQPARSWRIAAPVRNWSIRA